MGSALHVTGATPGFYNPWYTFDVYWLFSRNVLSTSGLARNAPLLVPSVVFAKHATSPKDS